MKAMHLTDFGLDHLAVIDTSEPGEPASGEVLVKFAAAAVNPRDSQIIAGQFTPNVEFPLIPLSDGAGEVVAVGPEVKRVAVGDLVTPLFFPNWFSGEALGAERAVSSGLEAPGVMRELAIYNEAAVVPAATHLSAAEAACLPCASLTAWTALVEKSGIGAGDCVLIQGTGGVAIAALQLVKALGAQAIVISSSDEKLQRAGELGADHAINYLADGRDGVLALQVEEDLGLVIRRGVAHREFEQETVQLRFGQGKGTLIFDGVLGSQHEEGAVQAAGDAVDRYLTLAHVLQQGALGAGCGPVDLVGQ